MKFSEVFKKIYKTIPLLVAEAEKAMKEGKITQDGRKNLVKLWIKIIADEFGIKLNFIVWWLLSMAINKAAKLLPSKDIIIPLVYKEF